MNSHALIKVDTQQSWLERALGARGARLLLAMGGTAAVVLTIPAPLIEQVATSTGLNEISKLFEPPIGVGTRVLLAGGLSLVPAAIVWALFGPRYMQRPAAASPVELDEQDYDYGAGSSPFAELSQTAQSDNDEDHGDADDMIQARKQSSGSGWGAIIRLVRGVAPETGDSPDATVSRRRRRDRHPDAPPRPPLFASRDLPPHEVRAAEPALAGTAASGDAPRSLADAVAFAQPRAAVAVAPPPRSPEPMSDDDIARVLATMPRSPLPLSEEEVSHIVAAIPASKAVSPTWIAPADAAPAPVASAPFAVAPAPSVSSPPVSTPSASQRTKSAASVLLQEIDLPLIDGADLSTLAARFERGLSKREVISLAEDAQHSLDARIAFAQPDPSVRAALREKRPFDVVAASVPSPALSLDEPAPEPTLHLDETVEQALNSALATLRKLTEQGRR